MPDPFTPMPGEKYFEERDYARVRALRQSGKLNQAEKALCRGVPVPAVLDELRKVASAKARLAKKAGDWAAVYAHLQAYNRYAASVTIRSLELVNQAPPEHTESDLRLLSEAEERISPPPQSHPSR